MKNKSKESYFEKIDGCLYYSFIHEYNYNIFFPNDNLLNIASLKVTYNNFFIWASYFMYSPERIHFKQIILN